MSPNSFETVCLHIVSDLFELYINNKGLIDYKEAFNKKNVYLVILKKKKHLSFFKLKSVQMVKNVSFPNSLKNLFAL